MLDFAPAAQLALAQLDAFRDRFAALPTADLGRPTRLEGWTVADLGRHVAAATWQQAEAFHRVRLGAAEAPSYLEVPTDGPPVPDALDAARRHLVSGLTAVPGDADPIVPLPFASLPASFAVQVLLIEYGVHLNDLAAAVGPEEALHPAVAAVQVELLPAFLPMVAARVADDNAGYRLVAPTTTTTLVCRDGSWEGGEPFPDLTCEIRGDDSTIALFALGRIGPDHGSLEVHDPPALAKRFKDFFPGP